MTDLTRGFTELAEELEDIVKNTDEAHRKKALDAGAEPIVEKARQIVNYSARRKGLLKKSGITKGDNTGDKIDIGWTNDGFYGRFVEYGTRKMSPRPHLRPAWEQRQDEALNRMKSEMKLK